MKTTIPRFSRTAALLCGATAAIGRHRYRQVSNGPRTERLSRSITGLLRHRNPTLKPLFARLQADHVADPLLPFATSLDQTPLRPLAHASVMGGSLRRQPPCRRPNRTHRSDCVLFDHRVSARKSAEGMANPMHLGGPFQTPLYLLT